MHASPEAPLDPRLVRRFRWASGLTGLAFRLEISALPLYFLTLGLPPPLYGLLVGAAWLVALGSRTGGADPLGIVCRLAPHLR